MSIERVLLWIPRLLAMAFALFLAMFATDVTLEGTDFIQTSTAFIAHLLPSACVVLILVLGWKRDGLAALGFLLLAGAFFIALSGWRNPVALPLTLPPLGICLAFLARMQLIRRSSSATGPDSGATQ